MVKLTFQTRTGDHGTIEGDAQSVALVNAALRASGKIEATTVVPDGAPPQTDPTPDVAGPADEPTPADPDPDAV